LPSYSTLGLSVRRPALVQTIMVGFAILLVGCAAPARADKMVLHVEPTAPPGLLERVTVADVSGSGEMNALAHSTVGDRELRDALQRSLALAKYQSPDPSTATVKLVVHLLALDNSDARNGLMVTSRIRYVLTGREAAQPLLDEVIPARCIVTIADSPLASARLTRATECSVVKNIAALLWRVRALALRLPLRAPAPLDLSSDEVAARVQRALDVPATALGQSFLEQLYATQLIALARAGARLVVADPHGPPVTITRENAEAQARQYADRLTFVYAPAIRRRGFRQIAGPYTLKAGAGCERMGTFARMGSEPPDAPTFYGFTDGPAWVEQREHLITVETGDALNEGVVIEDTVALQRQITGPEGWFFGTVAAERIELRNPRCTLTLTPTTPR
jgi:hypothetical protein